VRDGIGIGIGDARLNQVKARDAFLVEHGDLAVEDGLLRGHLVRHHRQFGILPFAA
jgi:hypothetical protein